MLSPIPRHTALINTDATPTMDAIFTLAIRQSFGLSRPQPSTPQIHLDSIIPFPMSVAIWAFWAHGQPRHFLKALLKVQSNKKRDKGTFVSLCYLFIYYCITGKFDKFIK